ncbi:bacteriocin immunity protein [Pseudomonas fontis]|uniref:Bacteriocin immunity protein n=1 Tax=Pseudomonas fontis TaxID=2942633 RepID=A0ABT5NR10_9PSED|nr:bacteriocin immunity protein [Pseudomonas fontis]MDD0972589.1 bacteriocin immunity protein [Pseudomonas fontis]MDD0990607.1 bacteriocin immunity protein [Pseudomonas fontis]
MEKLFSEYTEAEFLALVQEIFDGAQKIEAQNIKDVLEFERVSGHRSGSDLIYFPVNDADLTPESLVDEVKTWRAENGLPGFKIA